MDRGRWPTELRLSKDKRRSMSPSTTARLSTCRPSICGSTSPSAEVRATARPSARPCRASEMSRSSASSRSATMPSGSSSTTCTTPASTAGTICTNWGRAGRRSGKTYLAELDAKGLSRGRNGARPYAGRVRSCERCRDRSGATRDVGAEALGQSEDWLCCRGDVPGTERLRFDNPRRCVCGRTDLGGYRGARYRAGVCRTASRLDCPHSGGGRPMKSARRKNEKGRRTGPSSRTRTAINARRRGCRP